MTRLCPAASMPPLVVSVIDKGPFSMAVAFSVPQLAIFNTTLLEEEEWENIVIFDLAKSTIDKDYVPRVIPFSVYTCKMDSKVMALAFVEPPGCTPWLLVVMHHGHSGRVFLHALDLATEEARPILLPEEVLAQKVLTVGSRNGVVALGLGNGSKQVVHVFTGTGLGSSSSPLAPVSSFTINDPWTSKYPVLSADGTTLHILYTDVDMDSMTEITTVAVSGSMESAVTVDIGRTSATVMAALHPSRVIVRDLKDRSTFHAIDPLDKGSGHNSCRCCVNALGSTILETFQVSGCVMKSFFMKEMVVLPGFGAVVMLEENSESWTQAEIFVLVEEKNTGETFL